MNSPPIFVINLATRPERWSTWVKEAERTTLPEYKRFEAINGYEITITPEIQHLFRNNDFNMRRGVIGCALSHMSIWLHIVEQQIPAGIIFEDDARFNEPFEVPQLPQGWELFYYGGAPMKGVYPAAIPISETVGIPFLPEQLCFSSIGYMISYNGAKKLLDRVTKTGFYNAVDWFMKDAFVILNVFCYRRLRVYHDDSFGTDVQIL